MGGLNWEAVWMVEHRINDPHVLHNTHNHHCVGVALESCGEAFAPNQNQSCFLESYVEDSFHMVQEHMVDCEQETARDAGNHMLLGGQNESPADPIGVGHQIHHGVGDGPADQSHQMKA